jgi:hypothetical protein
MHQMTQWQQTDQADPYNPNQIARQPDNTWGPNATGGVSQFYFNKVPNTAQLSGLAGSFSFTSLDPGVQMLIVAIFAGAVGFVGMKYGGRALGFRGSRKAA